MVLSYIKGVYLMCERVNRCVPNPLLYLKKSSPTRKHSSKHVVAVLTLIKGSPKTPNKFNSWNASVKEPLTAVVLVNERHLSNEL